MARLRRVDCSAPGIRRVRRGRGFAYLTEDGETVRDPEALARIGELAIPPAWSDVWICSNPLGHIQATGHDAAGRKQYLYHERWREHRDRRKFEQMTRFGQALPTVRRELERDLGRRGLVRPRVLACAIRLLDLGLFRIGSERYASENGSYGLATLKRRQVTLARGKAVFDYPAKGSTRQLREVADPATLPTIRALKARRGGGTRFLAYRNGKGWRDLRSDEINDQLKELCGEEFSAKDFRTWNATVLAAVALADEEEAATKTARKRAVNQAIKRVAAYLGNTPAVCRSAYVDPRVIDRFHSGDTIRGAVELIPDQADLGGLPSRERIEAAVLDLIE